MGSVLANIGSAENRGVQAETLFAAAQRMGEPGVSPLADDH